MKFLIKKEKIMFEQATKMKLRFSSQRGSLTVEDLWDLSLADLDTIAKSINKNLKASEEESFLVSSSGKDSILELKLDILKHIIKIDQEEIEAKYRAIELHDKKEKIMEIISDKEDKKLKKNSINDLKEMLNEL